MARLLPLDHLVAIGDELVRIPRLGLEGRAEPYSCLEQLRTLVAGHPNLQGVVRARQALDLMRIGADSAPETFLRLAMLDAGLPEPELQILLRPADARSPSADLGYRRRRLAIQYDGGHHLLELQKLSDRRRNKAFEAAGWTVVIVRKEDLDDGFSGAIKEIKRALKSTRMDPAAASGFASAF